MMLSIIVLVKSVPDEQLQRQIDGECLRLDRRTSLISELDEYALEASLRLRESHNAAIDVVTVTMGPAVAGATARKTLQLGADSAVHIQDDALAASDALITSKVLAAAVHEIIENSDITRYLVITGMASPDGDTGLVPAQLAARLDIPLFSHCAALQLEDAEGRVTAISYSRGYKQELVTQLPAVISVTEQMPEPRYPNFKSILAAKKKEIKIWNLETLGLSAGEVGFLASPARIEKVQQCQQRTAGVLLNTADLEVEETAIQAVDFLIGRGIEFGDLGK